MSYDNVIQSQYNDLNNLSSLLRNYVEMYRVLISGATELNTNSAVKKGDVKDVVNKIDEIGDIIDDLIKVVKKCEGSYIKYCVLKNEVILAKTERDKIRNEISDELDNNNYNKVNE